MLTLKILRDINNLWIDLGIKVLCGQMGDQKALWNNLLYINDMIHFNNSHQILSPLKT